MEEANSEGEAADDDEQASEENELDVAVMQQISQEAAEAADFDHEVFEVEESLSSCDAGLLDGLNADWQEECEVVVPVDENEIKEEIRNQEASPDIEQNADCGAVSCEFTMKEENEEGKFVTMTPKKLPNLSKEFEDFVAKRGQMSLEVDDGQIIVLPEKRGRGRPKLDENSKKSKRPRLKMEPGEEGEIRDSNEFRFECSLCPKKYKSLLIYRKHMQDAHNIIDDTVVEYTCEECSKTFSSERHLAMHARSHLPLELKQVHPCPYCDKRFTKAAIMVNHISGTHLNEKPFVCEECGRALKTIAALREHKLTHTDECPFECEVCHKRFKNKARLKIHSDVHNSTTYNCNVCGIQLNTRRTLNMHMLVHSDVKAFKCDYCGNEFKRGKALKNHLIIHTGLKPYTCNFCNKSFSNGSNCRSHKKKSHPEELAAMEAEGKRFEPPNVPKLDHLRQVSKVSDNLMPVNRQSGLPANWREILVKAEERANQILEEVTPDEAQLLTADAAVIEAQLAAMGRSIKN